MRNAQRIPVVLAKAADYDVAAKAVQSLLSAIPIAVSPGDRVLIKPNLLKADGNGVTCTNATVIAAACRFLLDRGCRVTIGDSPGFGTAKGVAKSIGLYDELAKAGCGAVSVVTLDSPVFRPLRLGGRIGLSRHALEADHILNIPKLKAHSQMRVTASVKNLFGCVSGVRKAFLHARHGDKEISGIRVFPAVVADILDHLPPATTLLDAVRSMHVTGPANGKPYESGLLAAGPSPTALDTVVYTMLNLAPDATPVWRELQRRKTPGAHIEEVELFGENPGSFDFSGFMPPDVLKAETFNPARLMVSTARRLWARFRN